MTRLTKEEKAQVDAQLKRLADHRSEIEMTEAELDRELRSYGVDPEQLVQNAFQKVCVLAQRLGKEVERLKKELAKEKDRRLKGDLAFLVSDAILPPEFEPDLPPTIRLHKFIQKLQAEINSLKEPPDPLVMYIMRHFDDVVSDPRTLRCRAEAAVKDYMQDYDHGRLRKSSDLTSL